MRECIVIVRTHGDMLMQTTSAVGATVFGSRDRVIRHLTISTRASRCMNLCKCTIPLDEQRVKELDAMERERVLRALQTGDSVVPYGFQAYKDVDMVTS